MAQREPHAPCAGCVLALVLACALDSTAAATTVSVGSPLTLSGCPVPAPAAWGDRSLCGLYLPSPAVVCNGAPLWFSASDQQPLPALRRTGAGAWQLVAACSRAGCFADEAGVCADALSAGQGCAPLACDNSSLVYADDAGSPAQLDASALASLGTLTVAAVAAGPGFTCAPSNDAAQCAALGLLYATLGGDAWLKAAGWRAAAAGVASDFCGFAGVSCLPDDLYSWSPGYFAPDVVVECPRYTAHNSSAAAAACTFSLPAGFQYGLTVCPPAGQAAYGIAELSMQSSPGGTPVNATTLLGLSSRCDPAYIMSQAWPVPVTAPIDTNWTVLQSCAVDIGCAYTVRVYRAALPPRSPPANTTALRSLNLPYNGLVGTLPGAALGALGTLTYLSVSGNRISGTLPPELAVADGLLKLHVSNLQLSGTVPAAYDVLPLTEAWMHCAGVCGELPPSWGGSADLGLWANEFVPPCDCGQLRADGASSGAEFFCLNRRSPYSRIVWGSGGVMGAFVFYVVWRSQTNERGISMFIAHLRRAGFTTLAGIIARTSPSRRAARKLTRKLRAAQAAAPPAPLRELPSDALEGAGVEATLDGTRVRVRLLRSPLDDPKLLEEARALCAAPHANVLAPLAIMPSTGWVLYPRSDTATPLSAFLTGEHMSYNPALRLAADVATGLTFLHAQRPRPLLHGRLRVAAVEVEVNVLTRVFRARIVDAGLTAALPEPDVEATDDGDGDDEDAWRAPELDAKAVSAAGDVFSLGTLLWQIFHPSSGAPRGARPRLAMRLPARVRTLVSSCWEARAAERPLAAEVACALEREFVGRAGASGALGAITLRRLSEVSQAPSSGPRKWPQLGLSLAGLKAFMKTYHGCDIKPTPAEEDAYKKKPVGLPPMTKRFEELSTADVVVRIIKPLTEEQKCSYCELLRDGPDASLVGRANVFVSHAWGNRFVDTASAVLSRLDGKADSAHVFLWNDIFVSSQHNIETLLPSWWSDTFANAIKELGSTLLVLQPWANPLPLTRAWCLWEIFSTLDCASDGQSSNAQKHDHDKNRGSEQGSALGWRGLEIVLPPGEETAFQTSLAADGFDDILSAVNAIDARNASAFKKDEEQLIKDAVAASPGGFEFVNGGIKHRIGAWLLRCGHEAVKQAHKEPATLERRLAGLATANNLAHLLRDRHENDQAKAVEDAALAWAHQLRCELRATVKAEPARHPTAPVSPAEEALLRVERIQAAMLMSDPGGEHQAVELLRAVLARERYSTSFGPAHKDTLRDMKALADALMAASLQTSLLYVLERVGLVWLVRRVLRPSRKWCLLKLYGRDTNDDTRFDFCCALLFALPFSPLLLLLRDHDRRTLVPAWKAAAAALYSERVAVLSSSPELIQERAVEHARDLMRQAEFMRAQKLYVQMEKLYEQAYQTLMEMLGKEHHKTLACADVLATIYMTLGRRSTIVIHYGFPGPFWKLLLDTPGRRAKLAAAEALLRDALSHARNRLGAVHPLAVELAFSLAACLHRGAAAGDAHVEASLEAAALLDSVLDTLSSTLGQQHSRVTLARERALRIETLHDRENFWVAINFRSKLYVFFACGVFACFFVFIAMGSTGRRRDPWLNTRNSMPACAAVL